MAVRAKRVIYWFSGTGNSYRAAERIAQALGDTELVSMRCNPAEVSAEDAEMIGFVFPVYHWTLNESAQKFIEGLRINPRAYVFAVSTLALINGYAFEALDAILRRKGTRLQYARRLFSVANLCIVYPPFPSPGGVCLPRNGNCAALPPTCAGRQRTAMRRPDGSPGPSIRG